MLFVGYNVSASAKIVPMKQFTSFDEQADVY